MSDKRTKRPLGQNEFMVSLSMVAEIWDAEGRDLEVHALTTN